MESEDVWEGAIGSRFWGSSVPAYDYYTKVTLGVQDQIFRTMILHHLLFLRTR